MTGRIALAALLAFCVAVGGCGRRGALEPPPAEAAPAPQAQTIVPGARDEPPPPRVDDGGLTVGVDGRPVFEGGASRPDEGERRGDDVRRAPRTVPQTPFILDPLLD
jgi:predicted small lipoprotein YifL